MIAYDSKKRTFVFGGNDLTLIILSFITVLQFIAE